MFHGLSAFPITPADEHGRVDTDALSALLQRLQGAGVDSVGLLGSTGTYAYLSRAERRRAVEAAARCLGGRTPIIVGVGALRTDDASNLARDAEAAGANGLLLAPVSYTPLTNDEVFQHFASVARATRLPICIYNNPSTTHFTFSPDLLKRIASITNVVAVKNPAPGPSEVASEINLLRSKLPPEFAIGYSADWNSPAALLAGADAWYSVVGGLLPEPTLKLTRAAQRRDEAEVERINCQFAQLWTLFKELSSLRVMYAAANALGLCHAQPPRPILPLSAEGERRVMAALSALEERSDAL